MPQLALSGSMARGSSSGRFFQPSAVKNQTLSERANITSYNGVTVEQPVLMSSVTSKNTTNGNPAAPCLSVDIPGYWRFRWVVKAGPRSIYVSANQNSTGSLRPSVVIKANPSVGLTSDVSGSAANGVGWVQIGPVNFTATNSGVVWVELHNNNSAFVESPALFDHIITT